MAKHSQQWRDARWKQNERQKNAETGLIAKQMSDMAHEMSTAIDQLAENLNWTKEMREHFDSLRKFGPAPGVDFLEVLKGTPLRFVSQKWNGDGTYDVTFEVDVLSNDSEHEKVGVLTATALGVTYTAGRLEVHGRY